MSARNLLSNLLSMSAARLFSAGFSFLLFVAIARWWGPDAFGRYALLMTLFFLFQYAPLLGLHSALIRDIAALPSGSHDRERALVSSGLLVGLGGWVLTCVLVVAGAAFRSPTEPIDAAVAWLLLALLPSALTVLAEAYLIGREQIGISSRWMIAESLVRTMGTAVVVALDGNLTAVMAVLAATRALLAVAYWFKTPMGGLIVIRAMQKETLVYLIRLVPTFALIFVLGNLIARLDTLLLAAFGTIADVGRYAAPYKLYELLLMIPSMAVVAFVPVLSRLNATQPDRFREFFSLSLRIYLLLGLPLVLCGIVVSALIIQLYGAQYSGTHRVLQWLLAAVFCSGINQLLTTVVIITHRQHFDAAVLAGACGVLALLLSISIPRWGILGAAASVACVAVTQTIVRARICADVVPWHVWLPLLTRGSLAGLAFAGGTLSVLHVLPRDWAWSSAIFAAMTGIIAYSLLLYWLRGLRIEQFRDFARLLNQHKT